MTEVPGMHVLDALDADAVRRWSAAAVARLSAHRTEIDSLNVFPVADGDTGSNLLATMRAAADAIATGSDLGEDSGRDSGSDSGSDSAGELLAAMATGAAAGAVGNSGFIASQLLRGLANAARGAARLDTGAVVAGLTAGAALARTAVVTPIEGTVLTVADAAARAAAERFAGGGSLAAVVRAATEAAEVTLSLTPEQLPELARHGVVDAGGRGFVVLLHTLAGVITGEPVGDTIDDVAAPGAPVTHTDHSDFAYEVQYLLDVADADRVSLRRALSAAGGSIAIVEISEATWKVHVHVDDIGAAVEAGVAHGRVHGIEVVRFADQRSSGTAVVAVAPGAGLMHLFQAEGVVALGADPDRPPSFDDVLDAIRAATVDARAVVLLPNAARAVSAAEDAARIARRDGVRVAVVPTRSPVQGLAAIAVHDAERDFDDDVVAMAEAAAATRVAEISIAGERALTAVGLCEPGDVLGLIDGEVVEIGRGVVAVAFGLVDRLIGVGAELMTIVMGEAAPRRTGELVEAHIRGRAPLTDVAVYAGGQHDHPVIIGAE